jgi:aminoglycoside phosphotransferase (APT) family kinase protein
MAHAPVRFSPAPVIADLNELTGAQLHFVEMAVDGDSGGAAFVEWPDGRPGVLTRPPVSLADMQLAADVLAMASSAGLPVPRQELVVELTDGPAVVQERMPGRPHPRVDAAAIDAMVSVNDRFADILRGRSDVPVARMRDDRAYEYVAAHSDRTRRIIQRIREIDDEIPNEMTGEDLVHLDYARGNVLFDETGRVTAVVDWNCGVARGDRNFALVSLRSDLEWREQSPENRAGIDDSAVERLDQILDERIEPVLLRKYWAFWTMQKLPAAIWRNELDVLDVFLRLGEERLDID